jgi:hypothetical protein
LKFRRATLPAIRKDTLASPLNLDTLGEAVLSNRVLCHEKRRFKPSSGAALPGKEKERFLARQLQ